MHGKVIGTNNNIMKKEPIKPTPTLPLNANPIANKVPKDTFKGTQKVNSNPVLRGEDLKFNSSEFSFSFEEAEFASLDKELALLNKQLQKAVGLR